MVVILPNFLSMKYALKIMKNEFGIKPLGQAKIEGRTFKIVFPPCWCCFSFSQDKTFCLCISCKRSKKYGGCPIHVKKDKPIIVPDRGEALEEEYMIFLDAISFFKLTDKYEPKKRQENAAVPTSQLSRQG